MLVPLAPWVSRLSRAWAVPLAPGEPSARSKNGSIQLSPSRPLICGEGLTMFTAALPAAPPALAVTWQGSESGGAVKAPELLIWPAVVSQEIVGCVNIKTPNWSYAVAENVAEPPTVTGETDTLIDEAAGATVRLAAAVRLSDGSSTSLTTTLKTYVPALFKAATMLLAALVPLA